MSKDGKNCQLLNDNICSYPNQQNTPVFVKKAKPDQFRYKFICKYMFKLVDERIFALDNEFVNDTLLPARD